MFTPSGGRPEEAAFCPSGAGKVGADVQVRVREFDRGMSDELDQLDL
jgi:hypothetical protein